MLRDMLSFHGRIGRLRYFLLSTALGICVSLLVLLMVLTTAALTSAFSMDLKTGFPSVGVILTVIVAIAAYVWIGLALAAKRFRDIGWRPLYAFAGWTAAITAVVLIAIMSPPGYGHVVGLMGQAINFALFGCLVCWPGSGRGAEPHDTNFANRLPGRM
jgi:uncharacterized membrane protein YhaH (DUF805 family)